MADPRKRRAASPRERITKPPPHSNGTAKGVQTPGEPTAHQRYGTYRTLKVLQLLMEATNQFLTRFEPFLQDEIGEQAKDLLKDICHNMPIVNDHIDRMEGTATAPVADAASNGGCP